MPTDPALRETKKIKTKWNRRGVEIIATLAQLTVRARTRFKRVFRGKKLALREAAKEMD